MKGTFLQRFYSLFDSAVQLLEELCSSLSEAVVSRSLDVAYLADFFDKLNAVQLKLQGLWNELGAVQVRHHVLHEEVGALLTCIGRREFQHFPSLVEAQQLCRDHRQPPTLLHNHLEKVKEDMDTRFQHLIQLAVPDWVLDPFSADPLSVENFLQEDLQHDVKAKALFKPAWLLRVLV